MLQLIDTYVGERVAVGALSGRSPEVIKSCLRTFADHVGAIGVRDINRRHVETWLMRPDFKTLNSRRTSLSKLRGFAEWLVGVGELDRSFCAGVELKRESVQRLPRFLEVAEVRCVMSHALTPRDRLVLLLGVHMGLRRGEIRSILVEDLDMEHRGLHVRGKGGRGEVTRYVPVPAECWSAIMAVLASESRVAGPLIRSTQTGGVLNSSQMSKRVARAMTEAGVKLAPYDGKSLHALRHTCAQHLIDAGKEIRAVQGIMGHATQSTTEIYIRRDSSVTRDVIEGRNYA